MTPNFAVVLPVLIVAASALLVLVFTPAFPRKDSRFLALASFWGLGVAAFTVISQYRRGFAGTTAGGLVLVDNFSLWFDLIFLVAGGIAILASPSYLERENAGHGEYYALILFSVAGMMTMVGSENLLIIFLGLELLSIPLYILSGFLRDRARSVESALKYFLLGAFSTGFILYGIAFIYGATGSLDLQDIQKALAGGGVPRWTLAVGVGLTLVGFAFKIAAVPFHAWVPDVYQGAPTPIAALMAAGTKAAAFGALLRIVHTGLPLTAGIDWRAALGILAVLTMTVGNVIAIAQTNIKRLLAYSSIAHAGYLLIAVVARSREDAPGSTIQSGVQAAAFYLVSYTFMTMGAFVVASIVGKSGGSGEEGYSLSAYAGLGRRRPFLAIAMTVFMFSLTGIPPTAGFIGKLYIFKAAVEGHLWLLAVIGVLNSAIAAYYYLGPVVAMWMEKEADGPGPVRATPAVIAALAISSAATVILGVYPGPLLELARELYISL
jgi:NADH-quinone oxidoreductase subunit N